MSHFTSPYFAAVDLGSNSFHMIITRVHDDTLETIDKVKEMVQLARAMTNGKIAEDAQQRALECLERFAERLREIPSAQIRAVGTKSLRTASNARAFLEKAEVALGHPIAIISGFEEARLVYSGLAHCVTNDNNRRLVVDIGGASTEFIIGRDETPELLESLSFGCVSGTDRFLASGVNTKTLRQAYLSTCSDIEVIRPAYIRKGWDIAYGTSGTMRTIAELLAPVDGGAVIRREGLDQLYQNLGDNPSKTLQALPKLRSDVLPGGIAILKAIFDQFKIDKIHVADAALKNGLIYDTIGRAHNSDARVAAVAKLQRQYHVDTTQADRVAKCAVLFWRQIKSPDLPGVSRTKILSWAAMLHEVGLGVSHASHHQHSFYILSHSDLAGFGRYEQHILATLVRGHRKKLSELRFEGLTKQEKNAIYPMVLCLRIAVILHRRREELTFEPLLLQRAPSRYDLALPRGWLADNPLTAATLEKETQYFNNIGVTLTISHLLN